MTRVIRSAEAIEKGYFCFTDMPYSDFLEDPFVASQKLNTYDEMHPSRWIVEPVDHAVVSLCRYKYPDRDRIIFVGLSAQGDVAFIGQQEGFVERIAGAGLDEDDSEGFGLMNRIRQIGNRLYATGGGGQIYRREERGRWVHIDDGLLLPASQRGKIFRTLSDINGLREDDIYVVGDKGLIGWFDGVAWHTIQSPVDERLHAIAIESDDIIWICGKNGTLLKGNAREGFVDVSRIHDNDDFLSVARFDGRIYLARETGLSVYDGTRIDPVVTGLKPPLRDGQFLDSVDDVLWSFGYNDIVRFDGTTWVRFPTGP